MILVDGLRFRKDGDRWRCFESPGLLMLRGPERYRVGARTFGSLDDALQDLETGEGAVDLGRVGMASDLGPKLGHIPSRDIPTRFPGKGNRRRRGSIPLT